MPEPKRSEQPFRPDPTVRRRPKGPDVWAALERRIYREGDDPPYRFVGSRTAIHDPHAKLPGQDIGAAFNADDGAEQATAEQRMAAQEGMSVVPEAFPEGGDAVEPDAEAQTAALLKRASRK